jgi:uracil-DNA glycosylase
MASRAGSPPPATRPAARSDPRGRRGALERLREDAAGCRACPLWRDATQTVFGEGSSAAQIVLVGEQPGDQEDRAGHPFVGPAGAVLDRALQQAEIDRSLTYTTNAVKHFKHRVRGKRRIHQRPDTAETAACRRWLDAEIAQLHPRVIVCLGATAAHALLGGRPSIQGTRGHLIEREAGPPVLVTAHPSSALRQPTSEDRHRAIEEIVRDLRVAREAPARTPTGLTARARR